MNFTEIAENRQSCRNYDPTRDVENEKLEQILESARLSPSACNGQPYFITVCKGKAAKKVAKATGGNGFAEMICHSYRIDLDGQNIAVFPVYHPGANSQINRSFERQVEDWKRITEYYKTP